MLQTETRERTEFGEDPEAAVADAKPTGTPSLPAVCRELFFERCLWRGAPAYRCWCCRVCGSRAFSGDRRRGVDPLGEGLPVVALTHSVPALERWW
jgi:uncharacterized protein